MYKTQTRYKYIPVGSYSTYRCSRLNGTSSLSSDGLLFYTMQAIGMIVSSFRNNPEE